jgi:hypothetical protein
MAAEVKETGAMVGEVKLVVMVVSHCIDAITECVRNDSIVQSGLASNVCGSVCLVGVKVGQNIVKICFSADRGHQVRITANFFVEISDDNDVATGFPCFLEFIAKVRNALFAWVW